MDFIAWARLMPYAGGVEKPARRRKTNARALILVVSYGGSIGVTSFLGALRSSVRARHLQVRQVVFTCQ